MGGIIGENDLLEQ